MGAEETAQDLDASAEDPGAAPGRGGGGPGRWGGGGPPLAARRPGLEALGTQPRGVIPSVFVCL